MKEKIRAFVSADVDDCLLLQLSFSLPAPIALIIPSSKGIVLAGVKLFHLSTWVVKGFKALKISSCFLSGRLEELPGCCWKKFQQKQPVHHLLQNNTVNTFFPVTSSLVTWSPKPKLQTIRVWVKHGMGGNRK